MAELSKSAERLAAGRCPGFAVRFIGGVETELYRIDLTVVRPCPNKVRPGSDLCGIHEGVRERHRGKRATEAAARERMKIKEREQTYAMNLAMMLTDEVTRLGRRPVQFSAEHGQIILGRDAASELLDQLRLRK